MRTNMNIILITTLILLLIHAAGCETPSDSLNPNILNMNIWQPFEKSSQPLSEFIEPLYSYIISAYWMNYCWGSTYLLLEKLIEKTKQYPHIKYMVVIVMPDEAILSNYLKFVRNSWLFSNITYLGTIDGSFWPKSGLIEGTPAVAFVKKNKEFYEIFHPSLLLRDSLGIDRAIKAISE